MSKHPDDQDIINWFAQGGSKAEIAFSHLVQKYGDSLYRQIRFITRNHEHTNDVLQNVLVKVYQNLSGFKQESGLYTWLYRIARNETLNFISKEKRHKSVDLDQNFFEISAGHAVLDAHQPEFIESVFREAVLQLPEKQARVFQMKYFEEMKYSEISSVLNTSEGALKASYHIARQKIEEYVLSKLNQ